MLMKMVSSNYNHISTAIARFVNREIVKQVDEIEYERNRFCSAICSIYKTATYTREQISINLCHK
jgi:hypothetical protein